MCIDVVNDSADRTWLPFEVVFDHHKPVGGVCAFDREFGDRNAKILFQRYFIDAENSMRVSHAQDLRGDIHSIIAFQTMEEEPARGMIEREEDNQQEKGFAD